ncbi:S-adenosyl-L-methionine-dependent methyltransferase [Trametes maxima]|nr:S-adenosyl-L-methionine-dependent methyltransferase [Trametes maxima]
MSNLSYNVMSPPSAVPHSSVVPLPSSVSSIFWRALVTLARNTVLAALRNGIQDGQIDIVSQDGSVISIGQPAAVESKSRSRHGQITIHDETFWVRVFTWYDIGFAESFLNGEFTSPDLKEVLNIYVDNFRYGSLEGLSTIAYKFNTIVETLTLRFSHNLTKAIENVAGYDASNDLYRAMLSEEMQYSCPIWGDEEGGVRGDIEGRRISGDLESAQRRKIQYILRKARLRPGDRLLEIGSGWGGVAIAAARMGCTVDTITLSVEQRALALERVAEAGVADRVRVHLMDYRKMPKEFEKAFDACVSIEMLEAVGTEWMPTYIKQIDWALKDDRAAVVLSATTYPEVSYRPLQGNDFVRKYHWPNCIIPSATSLAVAFNETLKGRFSLETIEDFGSHYPRCLREWGRRLEENWSPKLVASLQERYPSLKDEKNMQILRRRWQYMFLYMEVAYSRAWLSLTTWTFVRPGHSADLCA